MHSIRSAPRATGYDDLFGMSVHAVISDPDGLARLDALMRERAEELGAEIEISYLSGVYFHQAVNSHAFVFRCAFPARSATPRSRSERGVCLDRLRCTALARLREFGMERFVSP